MERSDEYLFNKSFWEGVEALGDIAFLVTRRTLLTSIPVERVFVNTSDVILTTPKMGGYDALRVTINNATIHIEWLRNGEVKTLFKSICTNFVRKNIKAIVQELYDSWLIMRVRN